MIFKLIITDLPLDEQEAEIAKGNPEAFKIGADVDVDGNLGQLAAAVCSLMEKENAIAQVLIAAVEDYKERNPNN